MKVVVTGGAGFIGANLCRTLLEHGGYDEVVAFDDLSSGQGSNLDGLAVELIEGDLCDVDHVVVASSSSVYGANPVLPKHEGLKPSPVSPYAGQPRVRLAIVTPRDHRPAQRRSSGIHWNATTSRA